MPSPFPGMDPYLESPAFWRDFHDSLVIYCRDSLNDLLPDNYEARVEERLNLVESPDEASREVISDVSVGQMHPLPSRVPVATHPALTREPVSVGLPILDEARDAYIEVLQRPDRSLISVVEVLSPWNKKGPDRRVYLLKRNALLRQPVHLIELDLLIGGSRLPMSEPLPRGDYYAFVSRDGERTHSEVYAWALDQSLPAIRVPLKPPDGDLLLNLQTVFTTTYDRGRYLRSLGYQGPPPLPLPEQVLRWVDEVLASLRAPRKPGNGAGG